MSIGFSDKVKQGLVDHVVDVQGDVHAYREAISPDCIVGVCSLNNCLYPHCAVKSQVEELAAMKPPHHREQQLKAGPKQTTGHSMLFDKGWHSV